MDDAQLLALLQQRLGDAKWDAERPLLYYWPLYWADQEHEIRSRATKEGRMRLHVLPFFGAMKPGEIGLKACRRYRLHRLDEDSPRKGPDGRYLKTSPKTVDNELQDLRRLLSWLRKTERIAVNPLAGADTGELFSKQRAARVSIYEADALAKLLEAYRKHLGERAITMRAFVLVKIGSGCRRGEVATLTKPQFHLDAGIITIWKSKTGKPRETILSAEAREAIEALWDWHRLQSVPASCSWAFVNPATHRRIHPDTFTSWHRSACDAEGLQGPDGRYWLHDTRHTFVTMADRAGVSQNDAMDCTGHETDSMYRWYHTGNRENILRARARLEELKKK